MRSSPPVAIGSGVIERVLCDDLSRQRTFIRSIHIAAIRVQCQGSEAARDSLTDVRRRPIDCADEEMPLVVDIRVGIIRKYALGGRHRKGRILGRAIAAVGNCVGAVVRPVDRDHDVLADRTTVMIVDDHGRGEGHALAEAKEVPGTCRRCYRTSRSCRY